MNAPPLTVIRRGSAPVEKDEVSQPAAGGHETILFVEDEEMLAELLTTLLTAGGYTVLVARSGREAVEVFKSHAAEVSLLLTDLGLPELNGLDAFRKMREINPRLKAILATGYIDETLKKEMLRIGVLRVIQKPYMPDQILNEVRSALDVQE